MDRYSGVWIATGDKIRFKREWSGVRFSDEQCEALLNGEVIKFEAISSKTGKPYSAKGSLAEKEFNGKIFVGFEPDFSKKDFPAEKSNDDSDDRYSGVWKATGNKIRFKREWSGVRFSDEQCKDLLNSEIIVFEAISNKTGKPYIVKGSLAEKEFNGKKYVGFEPDFGKTGQSGAADYTFDFNLESSTQIRGVTGRMAADKDFMHNLYKNIAAALAAEKCPVSCFMGVVKTKSHRSANATGRILIEDHIAVIIRDKQQQQFVYAVHSLNSAQSAKTSGFWICRYALGIIRYEKETPDVLKTVERIIDRIVKNFGGSPRETGKPFPGRR